MSTNMGYLSQELVLQKMAHHFIYVILVYLLRPLVWMVTFMKEVPQKVTLAFKTPAISLTQPVETVEWTMTLVDSSAACHLKP